MLSASKAIVVVLPVLLLLMVAEAVVTRRRRGDAAYRLPDTIASLGVGIGSFALIAFFSFISIVFYNLVYERWAITQIPRSALTILAAVVVGDFLYYVFHRASHRINVLWAIHVVHHQSREQNLAVNFRIPWLQPVYQWFFYIPLALLGLPPAVFAVTRGISAVYNIFTHTRAVEKLGPFEAIFNTPSHHRVHHGLDEQYLDCNYGAIFIVWDRLFGTFVPEAEEPTYGTRRKIASWNPVWLNLEPFVHLAKLSRAAKDPWDRVKVWFMPPEWLPAGVVEPDHLSGSRDVAGRGFALASIARLALSFGVTLAIAGMLIAYGGTSLPQKFALLVLLLASFGAQAASIEAPGAGAKLDLARAVLLFAFAGWLSASSAKPLAAVAVAAAVLSAVSSLWFRFGREPAGARAGEPDAEGQPTSLPAEP